MKRKLPEIIIVCLLVVIIGLLSFLIFVNRKPTVNLSTDGEVSRTIMIYMVGSNLETDYSIATSDLEKINPSMIDLDNVNIILYTGGTLNWHNFISNAENAIYELDSSGFTKVKTYKRLNMGDASTFASFLNYGYENYQTDEYDLIIYDHGGAVDGAVYDDYSYDNLSLADFNEGLAKSKFGRDNKLELVLFRTCLNGTLEMANIFAPYADYLIASEEITNGAKGTSVLSFLNDVQVDDTPVEIGTKYIDNYHSVIKKIDPTGITVDPMYSIIDLSMVNEFTREFNDFMETVNVKDNYSALTKMRSALFQYGYSYYGEIDYDMVDLYTLVSGLRAFSDYDTTELFKLYDEMVIYNKSSLADSHGVSIYFPYRGSKTSKFVKVYNNLGFNKDYLNFIKEMQKENTSGQGSTYFNLEDAKKSGKEFTLTLSEEDVNNYAEAIYIIFKKDDAGLFTPIYSSDNMTLNQKTGELKTNISNNLIKITNSKGESAYINMIERNKNDQHVLNTTASLFGYRDGNFIADPVNVYFTVKNNKPKISQYITIKDGIIVNIEDYDRVDFTNTKYQIIDENGNYMETWKRDENLDIFEVSADENYKLSLSTLDDGEYYCVFKIVDIYGDSHYSKLSSIN